MSLTVNDVLKRINSLQVNKEMEETNCNHKWLFTEEELLNTPSVRAGMSLEQELTFRQRQAMLIQTIGLKAGLTQLAVNTSVIFMHRFFMYRTVKTFPRVHLALGFAFAGGKVEESARKLEHLIRTAVEVIRQNRNKEFLDKSDPLSYEMDSQWRAKMQILFENNCNIESPAYLEMRKLVLECETEIYGVIGFQLQIVHPHNYVIRMCALLGAENIKDISQYAYNLATASSQLTMLCLKYKPETIATMCLNIASKAHSVRFEPMKDSNVKWYQVLVPNTDFSEIEAVSEEFLHVIKGCPLLPSWMTSLARAPRPNNTRVMPGPSRGPGASSASAPPGGRQNPPAASSTIAPTASGNAPPSSTATPMPQNYPPRSQAPAASLSSSQVPDSRQLLISGRGSHLQNEAVISPGNKHISAETGASVLVAGASDAHVKDSSSHSRPHLSSSSAQMRPHHSSSALPVGAVQHQQHRPHPSGNGRPTNQTVVPAGSSSSRPVAKPQVSMNSQSVRPSQHPGQPGHHSAIHQALPRPTHDPARHPDAEHARDQSRSYSDALRGPHDHARSRDHSRPHESVRSHDTARHGHPDHRPDLGTDVKHISHSEPSLNRSQSSRPEHTSQRTSNLSPNTPPANALTVKSSPPEPATDVSQILSSSGDMPDTNINATSSPESLLKLQSNLDKQRHALSQGPKLSLTMYRERASAKSRTPAEQSTPGDNANALVNITDDTFTVGTNPESLTNSPADVAMRLGSGDLANFHKPQDSPNNPRIKIKVKRDPSSGERHAVKYADTGLKIKIKPIRSEASGGAEGGDTGPSGVGMASSASTPREEGEIVEDTPPSSGDSEQKSERLKIRLSVPKSDHGSSYNRRESDQGSNGHSGEHEQGHRPHHRSHHHSHHHSKSKKHSKHDRSRHEGKSSNKRSASALDHYDERPSKTSRSDTFSASAGDASHRHAGYSDFTSSNSSARSHQQNTGFSIHDAFSSTMPHNIFDDDDDPAHAHPPVTPTVESVPPHHERFHQLMADHRAKLSESRKPPLPKGQPQSSPPPPPPPSAM